MAHPIQDIDLPEDYPSFEDVDLVVMSSPALQTLYIVATSRD